MSRRSCRGWRLPRGLLAMLIAAEGRSVSEDSLAEGLWGDHPPRHPAGALQVYASRPRRVLPGTALQRATGCSRLLSADTDVERFRGHLVRAQALLANGRCADAPSATTACWAGSHGG